MRYAVTLIASVVIVGVVTVRPASAQVDLSGVWAPIMHEDQVERAPGPEIGDYLGLPINDAGRMRGESWDASILTMEEHTCKPHPSTYGFRGVGNLRITANFDQTNFTVMQDRHAHPVDGAAARDLDGRPSASAGLRSAHLAGLLDRPMGRQRARRRDQPPEGRVDAAQRPRAQRPRADDRAVLPPRRSAHAHLHHRGPGVSDRAARQDERLPADDRMARSSRTRVSRRSKSSETRATCRITCPVRIRTSASSRRSTTCRSKRRAAAPRRRCRSSRRSWRKRVRGRRRECASATVAFAAWLRVALAPTWRPGARRWRARAAAPPPRCGRGSSRATSG